MGKFTAVALTNEKEQVTGFIDHTGYFYPVDRGQIQPGQFHCEIPLSALEVGECINRLDQLVKAARSLNSSLDVSLSPEWTRLRKRVEALEEKLEKAAWAFSGEDEEED